MLKVPQKTDDTKRVDQPGEITETATEAIVAGDSSESKSIVDRIKKLLSGKFSFGGKSDDSTEEGIKDRAEDQTVVGRIKKFISGISRFGSKADDSTEEGVEDNAEEESPTEVTGDIHTDEMEGGIVKTDIEDPEPVEDLTEEVDHAVESDGTQTDDQVVSTAETTVENIDDEVLTTVYNESKPARTKKTGIIISVFIVIAAVILLLVASVERRSAKKALVQVNKVAESIKQMRGETLEEREQVTLSQIEGRELVIDALLLTRNGLELERANSDEVEVKRIIGVFISDIDERVTKIKSNIALLRNKLKEAD